MKQTGVPWLLVNIEQLNLFVFTFEETERGHVLPYRPFIPSPYPQAAPAES